MNIWTISLCAVALVIVLMVIYFHFDPEAWFQFRLTWAYFYNTYIGRYL